MVIHSARNDESAQTLQRDLVDCHPHYGIDGDVRIFKYDVDGDGVIETTDGDKVYAVFGFGRGGSAYYALDITGADGPALPVEEDQRRTADAGPGLVRTGDHSRQCRHHVQSDPQKFVVIFGAGYDTSPGDYYEYSTDGVG